MKPLDNLARVLNGGFVRLLKERPAEHLAAIAEGAKVVTATFGTRYPAIPAVAERAFNALATGERLEYAVGSVLGRGELHWLQIENQVRLRIGAQSWRGFLVAWLVHFLMHPYRERLCQCQQCARWFVDRTRNKSQRRCSRRCTIAWSNKQRGRIIR